MRSMREGVSLESNQRVRDPTTRIQIGDWAWPKLSACMKPGDRKCFASKRSRSVIRVLERFAFGTLLSA
ncbi:hypothetical protein D3C80_1868830 [compost metagenome]